jgi:opacity protein-like surface antigen/outer membrane protein OmpA-like peptidoglycan-associated protein
MGALLAGTVAAQPYPTIETFLGYTHVHTYEQTGVPSFSANGGRGEFVYNFNRWLGGVVNAGAVTNNSFAGFNIDNTQVFFMGGPRFTIHRGRFKPYVQAVFGGVHYTASTPVEIAGAGPLLPVPVIPVTARLNTNQTKFALAAGIGLDIKLTRRLSFRPGSVDYYYTRIGDLRALGDNSQNSIMYSAGLNFTFGGEQAAPPQPPPPQTKKCPDGSVVNINAACPKLNTSLSLTAQPTELCPGEKAQVIATSNNNADLNLLKFMWSVNGQPASQERSFIFTSQQAGTYTIELDATGDKFNPTSAKTSIVVHEYQPPTGTVTANPPQISAGDKSSLSSSFTGQCGGTIQPATYTASEGSVVGDQFDSSTVRFDPSNTAEQRKTITITAKAADNKSEGTATTTIEVIKKSTAAAIRLPDILFSHNSARVNNCGKRVLLEQLRSYYERDSTGTVVVVGHQSADEKAGDLSEQRALNAAAVVTAGTGVCLSVPQSQVKISAPGTDQQGVEFDSSFCSSSVPPGPSSEERRVVVWFVPKDAEVPASVTNAQPASATNVGTLGCPK